MGEGRRFGEEDQGILLEEKGGLMDGYMTMLAITLLTL